jgi:hypothetical protein
VDELTELKVVGRVIRNEKDEIIVKRGIYWNIEVLDIRWFLNDKPTRKGIRLNLEEAKMLYEILRRELNEDI